MLVSATPEAVRTNSCVPRLSSSSRIALVTADCEIVNWIAACEICPSSAVATKYFSCLRVNAMPPPA